MRIDFPRLVAGCAIAWAFAVAGCQSTPPAHTCVVTPNQLVECNEIDAS